MSKRVRKRMASVQQSLGCRRLRRRFSSPCRPRMCKKHPAIASWVELLLASPRGTLPVVKSDYVSLPNCGPHFDLRFVGLAEPLLTSARKAKVWDFMFSSHKEAMSVGTPAFLAIGLH